MPGQGQMPGGSPSDMAAIQEALRQALGEMMAQMSEMTGDIPRPFGGAGAVDAPCPSRRSARASPARLTGPATEAVDQLQQGMQSFMDQMLEQMAQLGAGPGPRPDHAAPRRGPRPAGPPDAGGQRHQHRGRGHSRGLGDGSAPARSWTNCAAASGDRARPELELDYIERLLERFLGSRRPPVAQTAGAAWAIYGAFRPWRIRSSRPVRPPGRRVPGAAPPRRRERRPFNACSTAIGDVVRAPPARGRRPVPGQLV